MYDYEVIPIHEVPQIMLDFPGRSGYIDAVPGELVWVLCVGTDALQLGRLAAINVVDRIELDLIPDIQLHKYREFRNK
ncbi:hypothetical protein OUZ56_018679 [Daphnia magna]|uniref:Uncharacterized protein n=1 Tax=Daphnia magna TaxID=35525 RepID=A0ABQ9Z9H6_9CRUS|nr:hypothetical protein OUZ56_018679 [Daphnia magna]